MVNAIAFENVKKQEKSSRLTVKLTVTVTVLQPIGEKRLVSIFSS